MKLVNRTPVVARVHLGSKNDEGLRVGMMVAKATYSFADPSAVELVEEPQPLFFEDTPTPEGILPSDIAPRFDDDFEVIFLGAAYATGSRPVARREVSLQVATDVRTLRVVGDRHWVPTEHGWAPSEPAAFTRMPLDWEHAFGGREDVEFDAGAIASFACLQNPSGRGYDPHAEAVAMSRALGAPEDYPRLPPTRRYLPNLEDPADPVAHPDDRPWPYCWATVPPTSSVSTEAALADRPDGKQTKLTARMWCRSHPCWIIERPGAGAPIELVGLVAGSERLRFSLPRLRVIADYAYGPKTGRRELNPQRLVILGESRQLTLLYRRRIALPPDAKSPLHVRIRLAEGWRTVPPRSA